MASNKPAIEITGYPKDTDRESLRSFLLTYGNILHCLFNPEATIVKFTDEEVTKKLIKSPPMFNESKLIVKPFNANRQDRKRKRNSSVPSNDLLIDKSTINQSKLLENLSKSNSINNQLNLFINAIELPLQEIHQNYTRVIFDLENVLRRQDLFRDCKAHPFGSTVTGLAFKGSDLDTFILIPLLRKEPPRNMPMPVFLVTQCRNVLHRRSDLFTKILAITRAKTPIVKTVHLPTGINCDISFKNLLGVRNSLLVKYLLNLDSRIRPVMLILKYWAKTNEAVGIGKLTNYTLVMLLVFYLQQEPAILPPIINLQNRRFEEVIIGWDTGFNDQYYFLTMNKLSIPELLQGFFKFYSSYEYSLKVIAPYTATNIRRSDFDQNLGKVFYRYKSMLREGTIEPFQTESYMCVQDPFEHNHNLTKNVTLVAMKHFVSVCSIGFRICEQFKSVELLPNLLSDQVPQEIQIAGVYEIELLATGALPVVDDEIFNNADKENLQRNMWYKHVKEVLIKIMEQIMKMEVICESESKDDEYKFTLNCKGYYNVHTGRRKAQPKVRRLSGTFSRFQIEVNISDNLISNIKKPADPILNFDIEFTAVKNPTKILLVIKNRNKQLKLHYLPCMQFLQSRLPKWIEHRIEEKKTNQENISIETNENETSQENTCIENNENEINQDNTSVETKVHTE